MICSLCIIFCIILFFYHYMFFFSIWRSWAANYLIAAYVNFSALVNTRNFSYFVVLPVITLRTSTFFSQFFPDFTTSPCVISLAELHNSSFWPLLVGVLVVALDAFRVSHMSNVQYLISLYFSIIHLSCTSILLEMMTILPQNAIVPKL